MSMLAESRRKQKWSLNPRGKYWSEDPNKFGQKMLEKMGWTSGKGLGANEQGITEHVRVTFKNDNAGIGYSDKTDQAWTEQQDNFNDFLQQLQGSQESAATSNPVNPAGTLSGTSLEQKSKQSRARVHYQKFTRGKDVNKYSTKDLANIFGQKDLNAKIVQQEEPDEYVPDTIGSVHKSGGVCTVTGGSITDYFTNKSRKYIKSEKNQGKINRDSNSESETEKHIGFGFTFSDPPKEEDSKKSNGVSNYVFDNPCLNMNGMTDSISHVINHKSSKKRKKEYAFENGGLDLNYSDESTNPKATKNNSLPQQNGGMSFVNDALNLDTQTDESRNGKEFEVSRAEFGLNNIALDITDEKADKKRVTFNDHVEYSTISGAKKKKTTLDKFQVESGKRKKKRKREECENNLTSVGIVNTALDLDVISEEVNDNEVNEQKIKKVKRKKEKRISNLETIEEAVDESKEMQGNISADTITLDESIEECPQVNEDITTPSISKKKKKKKEKRKEKNQGAVHITVIDIANKPEIICLDETIEHTKIEDDEPEIEEIPVSKEKKKKKKKVDDKAKPPVDNDVKEIETITLNDQAVEDVGTKKKKKHKKSSTKRTEIVEGSTSHQDTADSKEVSDMEHSSQDLVENISETNLSKKEKKAKKSKDKEQSQTNLSLDEGTQIKTKHTEAYVENRQSSWQGCRNKNVGRAIGNQSPWVGKGRMSKRMLLTLFQRNLIEDFPGSNIHGIKGYAVDIGCHV